MTDLVVRYPGRSASSRVRIARGALAHLGGFARRTLGAGRVVVVSDTLVAKLHGAAALRALARGGIEASLLKVPRGERAKSPHQLARLWEHFSTLGLTRRDAVVALGGGVVGDLAGFAAASWLRGVPWLCVPTTVLAQVDSSVGGKTGVNLVSGKNLVGAFHQPAGVLVDPDLLATLPARERRAGLAEVVKIGFATDAGLFAWVERNARALSAGRPEALLAAVRRAIRAKARVVAGDEREREGGGRAALNFGHTLGHALEAAHEYRGLRHGEAIAVGMRVAAALSESELGLAGRERERLERALDTLALPRRIPGTALTRLTRAMARDKKRGHAGVRWVLTPRIGHASVPRLISGRRVRAALLEAGARA